MAKPFSELTKKMSPAALRASEKITQRLMKEMALQELRQARSISQEQLAKILETKQASISRFEGRKDMHISTLRKYVHALGGRLDIIAHFPEGDIRIDQFSDN